MFSRLTIADPEIDRGAIAEAMVYYGRVSAVTNGHHLARLVEEIGFGALMRCLDLGLLELVYRPSMLGVESSQTEGSLFALRQINLVPEKLQNKRMNSPATFEEDIEERFERKFGRTASARKQAATISARVSPFAHEGELLRGAESDIFDHDYMASLLRLKLMEGGRAPPNDFRIVQKRFDGRILFHANIDWKAAGFTKAEFLVTAIQVREQLFHSASRNSEVWIAPSTTPFVSERINSLAASVATDANPRIDRFETVHLHGRSFREAINSNERSFVDVADLLEKAETARFKKWLEGLPPTAELITEYDKAIFSEALSTRGLPFKTLRSLLFTGIGAGIGALTDGHGVVGAAVGAVADQAVEQGLDYVQSKLLHGWRPNQFVDGPAAKFLEK